MKFEQCFIIVTLTSPKLVYDRDPALQIMYTNLGLITFHYRLNLQ